MPLLLLWLQLIAAVFRDDTIATAVGSFFLLAFINTTGAQHSTAQHSMRANAAACSSCNMLTAVAA
jgi:hypothetical protein